MTSSLTPQRRLRVLCYSPYNRWALHGQWEATVLHALRNRGADVHHVLCDGLYTDCDVFWAATEPRPGNACTLCQAQVTTLMFHLGMEFTWLGRYLTLPERREARRWADSLPVEELKTACYGDWEVGAWVAGSVHSHLRDSVLDLADERVVAALRSYAYSGLIACFGLDRLLEDYEPDVLFLFNGRMASPRVAMELARRRGIRVVCHERGPRNEQLALTDGGNASSLEGVRRYWREWGDVPLDADELSRIVTHLHGRERGIDLNCQSFNPTRHDAAAVRSALRLDPARPTWVLFTSSDDEVAADTEWHGDFPSQLDWIERTIDHARRHPEIDLVVRVHPNTGSRVSTGLNRGQLEQLKRLRRGLPRNVRMVGAEEELNSYTLMDIATVGLVYFSTAGLEIACKGKATVSAARGVVAGLPFVHTVEDAAAYDELLDELRELPAGAAFPEVARLAHRFAYGLFFRIPIDFPLVQMPSVSQGQVRWSSPDRLVPGFDEGLDRCVRIVLGDEPICPPPGAEELARGEDVENELFGITGPASVTALAFAEELIADVALLRAWGEEFPAGADVTLVIQTPADATERLIDAVSRAGLDGAGGPDLMAVDADPAELCPVDAVYSRRPQDGVVGQAPRYDDGSLAALRDFRVCVAR